MMAARTDLEPAYGPASGRGLPLYPVSGAAITRDPSIPGPTSKSDRSGSRIQRVRRAPIAAIAATVAWLEYGSPAMAQPAQATAARQTIAFAQSDGSHDQIWSMNTDGSGLIQLTHDQVDDEDPVWSPDGDRIAFISGGHPTVMNADGSGELPLSTTLTTGPGNTQTQDLITWSPDGTEVAFVSPSNGSGPTGPTVWTIPSSGGTPQRVFAGPRPTASGEQSIIDSVAWSPDGGQIAAFMEVNTEEGTSTSIGVANVDGTGFHEMSDIGPSGPGPLFAWSPDGRRIAYAAGKLTTAAPDGSAPSTPGNEMARSVESWSPDGAWVVYDLPRIGPGNQTVNDLWSVAPGGTGGHELAAASQANQWDQQAVWSPDASQVVYTAEVGSTRNLYLTNPDGSGSLQLTSTGSAHDPSFAPTIARRYLGVLRTDTAVDVARNTWTSAPAVVIARDDMYPDALAGAPVAAKVGGPLLLTDPNTLPSSVCAEISQLGAKNAYILGDASAVSAGVESQLSACGITSTERLQGPTRFDTAAAAAEFVTGKSVYITEGADPDPTRGWPDAVSVSALSATQQQPILLVTADELPPPTQNALKAMGVTKATIIGGTASVSDQVQSQIESMGISVARIAGADRYATSAAVASAAAQAGLSADRPWLAIGNNWPDALAAGPAAAKAGGDLLLVDGVSLDNSTASRDWLSTEGSAISSIRLIGGPDVLSPQDAVQSLQIAGG